MLIKLLSTVIFWYKKLTTYPDYHIISEELEYKIDYRIKYQIEDEFWKNESKDWDGVLDEFYVLVSGKNFRNTIVPQNVKKLILRVKYWYGGKIYKAVSTNINFKPGQVVEEGMKFSIPISSAWIVDHDDKPQVNITEKVKRYTGPRNDFTGNLYHYKIFYITQRRCFRRSTPKCYF